MQDIHRLRGVSRDLTRFEKLMFAAALTEHMKAEYSPKDSTDG